MTENFDFHLKPLALAETALGSLLNGNLAAAEVRNDTDTTSGGTSKSAGVLTIRGALYPSTYRRIEYLLETMAENCDSIIMEINSPGGMLAGCFDLVDRIYLLRQKVKIYVLTDEICCSGAYLLASAAHKIYLARSAGVGSIGVITTHIDQGGFDSKLGVKYTPIFAGSKKNDRNPHFSLSDRARADIQKFIDDSYETFCQIVARNRGMLAASVKKTEAGVFYGQDAVQAGLVDAIANRREAVISIASQGTGTATAKTETPAPQVRQPERLNPLVEDAKARAASTGGGNPLIENAKARNSSPNIARPALTGTSYFH